MCGSILQWHLAASAEREAAFEMELKSHMERVMD